MNAELRRRKLLFQDAQATALITALRVGIGAIMVILFALLQGGCQKQETSNPDSASSIGQQKTVVVYSPHGQEMLDEYAHAFEEAHPDIKVVGSFVPTGQIIAKLRIDKDSPKVDIWWGGTSAFFSQAAEAGLLQPYRPSWAEHSESDHHDSNDLWYAQFLSAPAVMYNQNIYKQEEVPATWNDLLAPKWRDKLVFREPMDSGTMKTIFAGIIWQLGGGPNNPEPGYAFLKKLYEQTHTYLPNPEALYNRIAKSPEGYISLWNLTDIIYQNRANKLPFMYRVPEGPVPVSIDPIGIVANAPHPEEAKLFYEFVTSKENCLKLARDHYRLLARTDIQPAELPDWMKGIRFDAMQLDLKTFDRVQVKWMNHWRKSIRNPEK